MTAITSMVTELATAMFSVGSQLITWITAEGNELALVSIVLFVLVALIGGIRKLLPGV